MINSLVTMIASSFRKPLNSFTCAKMFLENKSSSNSSLSFLLKPFKHVSTDSRMDINHFECWSIFLLKTFSSIICSNFDLRLSNSVCFISFIESSNSKRKSVAARNPCLTESPNFPSRKFA